MHPLRPTKSHFLQNHRPFQVVENYTRILVGWHGALWVLRKYCARGLMQTICRPIQEAQFIKTLPSTHVVSLFLRCSFQNTSVAFLSSLVLEFSFLNFLLVVSLQGDVSIHLNQSILVEIQLNQSLIVFEKVSRATENTIKLNHQWAEAGLGLAPS